MSSFLKSLLLSSILISHSALADVEFQMGFMLVNGMPVYKAKEILPSQILVCPKMCVIKINDSSVTIRRAGFTTWEQFQVIKKEVVSTPDLSAGGAGGAGSESGDQKSDVETKSTHQDEAPAVAEEKVEEVVEDGAPPDPNPRFPPSAHRYQPSPYPKDNTLFLFQAGENVILRPAKKCKQTCVFVVQSEKGKRQEAQFAGGKDTTITIHIDANWSGIVKWSLVDGTTTVKGQFEVQRLSPQALKAAIKANRSIEILP
ncbi:MAG: hypothetical protein AB7F59_14070 [Bdellovibrionales bacterium]